MIEFWGLCTKQPPPPPPPEAERLATRSVCVCECLSVCISATSGPVLDRRLSLRVCSSDVYFYFAHIFSIRSAADFKSCLTEGQKEPLRGEITDVEKCFQILNIRFVDFLLRPMSLSVWFGGAARWAGVAQGTTTSWPLGVTLELSTLAL